MNTPHTTRTIFISLVACMVVAATLSVKASTNDAISPYYMERLYLEPSALAERQILKATEPTHTLSANVLAMTDKKADIEGWWESGHDAQGYATVLGIARIQDSMYLIHFISDSCTLGYRLYRHGTLSNGVLTLDLPIGDWTDPYSQLLAISSTNSLWLVPSAVLDKCNLAEVVNGTETIPYYQLGTAFFTKVDPNKWKDR
jgi:hypothetical protein